MGKLTENIILFVPYIIPVNQAGFLKGRSTIDHVVNYLHIKTVFEKEKCAFYDVKKSI